MQKDYKPHPNSFKNTFCIFDEVLPEAINGLKKQFESKSGSSYYYSKEGMYRVSNHWGRLANSKWRLIPLEPETASKIKIGFAKWDCFYPDNNTDKLYYLEMDYVKNTVSYQHKLNPNYNQKKLLRTSQETTKRIKQVRNIIELTSWANHFESDDITLLRSLIIEELINSNKSLDCIKREVAEKLSN